MASPSAATGPFFDHPILNSPDARPTRHWELDAQGQPTERVIDKRRPVSFVTPIPRPRKRKSDARQGELNLAGGSAGAASNQMIDGVARP